MRNTVILIVLALALGAYVYFYEIKGEETRNAEKEQSEKLIAIEKDSIQTFTIFDFEKTFRFEKREGQWLITNPVQTEAEESTVNSFLSSLSDAKKDRSFSVKENEKATYGLRNAGIRISVEDANGVSDSIHLGDKTSIGEDMYVSKGDSIVSISPISLKNTAQKTLFSWRDKRVVRISKDDVRAFNLKNENGEFSFEKVNSEWHLVKPLETKADNSGISDILGKLDYGRIKTVADEKSYNLNKYGLSSPQYRVEVFTNPEKAKSTVLFSKLNDNTAYGKDESREHIFTVDSLFIKPFKKSLFELRDKDLVDFDTDKIDRINHLYNNELLMFTKDTLGTWKITNGEPVINSKIKDMLNAVSNMKVDAFIAENPSYTFPYGLTNPRGKLEFFAGDSKEVELEIGLNKDNRTYLKNPRTGQVVAVNNDKMEKVLLKKEDLIEKQNE